MKDRKSITLHLERQLLHYLLRDKMILQRYYGLCKTDWWTSDVRHFLYLKIMEYYEEHRSTLSLDQFEFELKRHFSDDEEKQKIYKSEYSIVKDTEPTNDIELIISKLNETDLSIEIDSILVKSYDKLKSGDIDGAAALLKSSSIGLHRSERKGRILSLHGDTQDWIEEIHNRKNFPDRYAGIKTGFPTFDKRTGGMFPAELTVIFGLSGKGKSTVMKAVSSNVRRAGYNVLHCGNEENEFQMRTKYQALESGVPYHRFKEGTFSVEEFEGWQKYNDEQRAKGRGELYLFEFAQGEDATSIERAVVELKLKGIKIDMIVVDYLDLMSPIKKCYGGENEEQGAVTNELKQLSINCNCPVLTCTQAGTQAEKQEMKDRPFLTASDVFGTKKKVHSANVLWGIVNQTATVGVGERTEEERTVHKLVMAIPKNRDGGIFTFRCKMFVKTGLVVEDDESDSLNEEIARQALEMINDKNESGTIRSCIDLQAAAEATNASLSRRIEDMVSKMDSGQTDLGGEDTVGLDDADAEVKEEDKSDETKGEKYIPTFLRNRLKLNE